jgi:hypothetical protein
MKPNLSPMMNTNMTKISQHAETPKIIEQKQEDLSIPDTSSPTLDRSLVSPNKKSLLDTNNLSQKQKNLHNQISKFDFSFKKKQESDSKKLSKSLLSDLSVKLSINTEMLSHEQFESILDFRSRQMNQSVRQSCFRVSQSALILCSLLRGKLSDQVSFMGSLRKIWGNTLKRKDLTKILKTVDYQVTISSNQVFPYPNESVQKQFKNLKVEFVNVSLFDFRELK